MSSGDSGEEPLAKGWEKRVSRTHGRTYYFNKKTGESTWDPPVDRGDGKEKTVEEDEEITCSHILKKHTLSRRPHTWRGEKVTRSREEAEAEIRRIRSEIKSGARDWFAAAQEESDCSSAKRGGNLGPFTRGTMQAPFEKVAFSLRVGQMSKVVHTDSGVHIILRTA